MPSILFSTFLLFAPLTLQEIGTRTPVPQSDVRRGGQTIAIYDVRDVLLDMGRGFPAPRLGQIEAVLPPVAAHSVTSTTTPSEPTEAEIDAMCTTNGVVLADFLRRHVQPTLSDPTERIACTSSGNLVCNLLPEQQESARALLDELRRHDGYIEIRARFLTASSEVVKQWGLDATSVLATPEALQALERKLAESTLFEQLTAPALMALPGQRSSITVASAVTVVQDWVLQVVEPNGREIADPRLGVIHEGIALDVRALPVPGGLFDLELDVQRAKIRKPMRTATVELGSSRLEVEIALPEVDSQRFQSRFAIRSGTGVILVGAGDDPSKKLVVLVTARHVDRGPVRSR